MYHHTAPPCTPYPIPPSSCTHVRTPLRTPPSYPTPVPALSPYCTPFIVNKTLFCWQFLLTKRVFVRNVPGAVSTKGPFVCKFCQQNRCRCNLWRGTGAMLEEVQCNARTRYSQRVPVASGGATFLQHNIGTKSSITHYFVVIRSFKRNARRFLYRSLKSSIDPWYQKCPRDLFWLGFKVPIAEDEQTQWRKLRIKCYSWRIPFENVRSIASRWHHGSIMAAPGCTMFVPWSYYAPSCRTIRAYLRTPLQHVT